MRTSITTLQKETLASIRASMKKAMARVCANPGGRLCIWLVNVILGVLLVPSALCADKGQLVHGEIDSPSLKGNLFGDASVRPYIVYLPPSYNRTTNSYPVIYALHGYGDDETLLTKNSEAVPSAVPPLLDSIIAARQLGEVIVVFVSATNQLYGSFYLNSAVIADYESYITSDLVNHIDSIYRTLATRESRGITGYSMGGWGASHLALKFPNVFSVLVAEAGFYDSQSAWFEEISRQLAAVLPSSLSKFDALDFPNNAVQALFAGLLPNPQRPPLFTDYLYEMVAGRLTTNTAAIQEASERDVQNGDLPRYLSQPLRLTAIKIVHGTQDQVVPISEARSFTNALKISGIPCAYEQHSGAHIFRADLALPFLVTNLIGAEKYIEPPRLALARTTNQVVMTFSTQSGVSYGIEWNPSLEPNSANWTTGTSITGNGQIASFAAPLDDGATYFRVRARND
jgi:S-formylglutathione hydrolase